MKTQTRWLAVLMFLAAFWAEASEGATWTLTGSMAVPRRDHTATLLMSGKVLIAGGTGTATELYDPAAGVFSLTGQSLFDHGQGPIAVRLRDGRVLVAGGFGSGTGAEIYDPATGTFSMTGALNVGRYFGAGVLLPGGRVLIAGGGPVAAGSSAEIYDPTNGTFNLTANLNISRNGPVATLLPDGRVLLAGGFSEVTLSCLNSAELYNPVTGSFTVTGIMRAARCSIWWSQAPVLPDGSVLITGGGLDLGSAELYNPANGMFSATGNMTSPHSAATATLLANGQVLVAGGVVAIGPITSSTAELYNPAIGTFTASANMNIARQQHTATLLPDGRVLVTGGFSSPIGQDVNSAELFSTGLTDNRPPIADAGLDQRVECTGMAGANVTLDGSHSSDPDGDPLTFTWTGPFGSRTGAVVTVTLPLGIHTATLTVDDGKGGVASASILITVRDTTPPTLNVSVQPSTLWPPSHNLVKITASVQVGDFCDPHPTLVLVSITSNEADDGLGEDDMPADVQGAFFGTDDREFFLRAERSGRGAGRIYTITYRATDASGNAVLATTEVKVPHDHRP